MKFFQFLSLLFTEIYLDWYFNHRQQLLDGLNQALQTYKALDLRLKELQRLRAEAIL
jgi:hypothetical protein